MNGYGIVACMGQSHCQDGDILTMMGLRKFSLAIVKDFVPLYPLSLHIQGLCL